MSQSFASPPVDPSLQGPGSPQDVSSVAPLPGIFLVSGKTGDSTANSPERLPLPQDNESDDEAPFEAGTPGPFSNDPLEELKNQVNHINHLLVRLDKQDVAIIEMNDRLTAQTANSERLDRQVNQQKSSIDNVANSVVQYGRAVVKLAADLDSFRLSVQSQGRSPRRRPEVELCGMLTNKGHPCRNSLARCPYRRSGMHPAQPTDSPSSSQTESSSDEPTE
ncbi:unnamed protein product [Aphanomyces euteiches]|nr:hypothetical protein Ae201684P_022227 [Aphanomyces euteiches]KAH9137697.1 hypothetical protein AeRB84_017695 [Aphanomyces euteiches]